MNPQESITFLETSLNRQLKWIKAADSKIPSIFAFDTAMLGILAALLPNVTNWYFCMMLLTVVTVTLLILSLLFIAVAVFPRTGCPQKSLIYCGSIADNSADSYLQNVISLDQNNYMEDLSVQTHRNAEIAKTKFKWIKHAMQALFVASPLWLILIYIIHISKL